MTSNQQLILGDPTLDEEHARLHRAIAQLASSGADLRLSALDQLQQESHAHFRAEDVDLRAMGDGNAKCHLDEHAAVLRSLEEVREVLLDAQRDDAFKVTLVVRLTDQLLDWLPMHVREMDAGLARFKVTQRFGGSPVVIARR